MPALIAPSPLARKPVPTAALLLGRTLAIVIGIAGAAAIGMGTATLTFDVVHHLNSPPATIQSWVGKALP
jgi:hypothetical protein